MKQVKPNRLAKANEEVKDLGVTLPETINEADTDHFVVAMIKTTANTTTRKFESKVTIQMYDKEQWPELSERIQSIFDGEMVILHDPTAAKGKEA